jgi:hypothetical protein
MDSDVDSAPAFYFRHSPSRRQQKTNLKKVFLLKKVHKRSHKTVGIKVFLTIFA